MSKQRQQVKVNESNPYSRGNYSTLFGYIQKKGIVTRKEVESRASKLVTNYGKNKGNKMLSGAVSAMSIVILSPREHDGQGDCRGSYSAKGHIYFMKKLEKRTAKGSIRYELHFREDALPKRLRSEIHKIEQEVSKKSTKMKSTNKKTSKA